MPKSNPASQRWNVLSSTRNSTVAGPRKRHEGKPLHLIARLPAGILLGFVRLYQRVVSPVLPAIFGSACGCRFHPTCSHYAAEALSHHGALTGSWLTLKRLAKCNPLHSGGLDPVPLPRCTRVSSPPKTTLSHG